MRRSSTSSGAASARGRYAQRDDNLAAIDRIADELVALFADADPLLSSLSLRRAADRLDRERRRAHTPRGARHLRRDGDEPAEAKPAHRVLLEGRT